MIGVVLAGLSAGYWIGGVLADRYPAPQLLLGVLALGGGLTLLIPVVDDHVLEAVVEWDLGPRWNPLVAAVILFGLPSVILATATPIAVRLTRRLADEAWGRQPDACSPSPPRAASPAPLRRPSS